MNYGGTPKRKEVDLNEKIGNQKEPKESENSEG